MVQIFKLQDPLHANLNGAALFDVAGKSKDPERDLSALSAAARAKAIEVMGQLGKLGDETFPATILEYVGLRSKMYRHGFWKSPPRGRTRTLPALRLL